VAAAVLAAAARREIGDLLFNNKVDCVKIDHFLTLEEKAAIKKAVQDAESRTCGEIKVLVVGASKKPWSLSSPAKAVRRRAHREFNAMGIRNTAEHTGILIMLSLKERRVEVVADKGINDKVMQKTWEDIVEIIVGNIQRGKQAAGIIQAVDFAGKVLAEHFPRQKGDKNELSDDVEIKG
jgi:uncharacterized membrane protein